GEGGRRERPGLGGDLLAAVLQGAEQLARGGVPQADEAVARAGGDHAGAGGREGGGGNVAGLMPVQAAQFLAGVHVPEPDRAVAAGRQQPVVRGRGPEGEGGNVARVAQALRTQAGQDTRGQGGAGRLSRLLDDRGFFLCRV